MSNIFFVESPLNLICTSEAISFFKIKDYRIVIRLSTSDNNNNQIINLIDILGIDQGKIEFIKIHSNNKNTLDYLKIFLYVFRSLFDFRSKRVFIGNLHSGFLSLIARAFSKNKIILIDDGAKTIVIQKSFDTEYFYKLFTMYNIRPLSGQMIYKNNFEKISQLVTRLEIDKNSILFLGSKLYEENIVSESYYLELVNRIFRKYLDKRIIYIPHREESQKKITKINSMENVSIRELSYPVELFGLYEDEIPYKAISFYSTALLTMKNLYGIDVEGYYFNYKGSVYEKDIDAIYSFYEKEMRVVR